MTEQTINEVIFKYPDLWTPRPRAKRIPMAFMINPENRQELIVKPEIALIIEEGLQHYQNGLSLRECSDAVNGKLAQYSLSISHSGLIVIWGHHYKSRVLETHNLKSD